MEQRLRRVGLHLREHDQHHRGRHARGGVPRGADALVNKFAPRVGGPEGEGRQPHRRRRPRGADRDRLGQARRAAVRGADQDQARQHRGEDVRAEGRQRAARRVVRAEPRRGQGDRPQGGRPRRRRGSPPARRATSPAAARGCSSPAALPGKLADCQSTEPERVRALHRRGRLAPAARPRAAATPRFQAILPIRGKILNVEKARIDKVLQNNEVQALISALGTGIHDDFDIEQAPLSQDHPDGRRRRRRPAHPHPAADAPVPVHAPARRGRQRLLRPAAALQDQVAWQGAGAVRVLRPRARRADRRSAPRPASGCPRRTASSASRVWARCRPRSCGTPRWTRTHRVLHAGHARGRRRRPTSCSAVLMGEDVEARRSFIQRNAKDVRFLDI